MGNSLDNNRRERIGYDSGGMSTYINEKSFHINCVTTVPPPPVCEVKWPSKVHISVGTTW